MPRFSHDMCFVILINSTQNFHSLWAQVYFSPEGRGAGIGYVTLQCIGYVTLQFTWSPHRALQYFHDSSLSLHSPLSILHSPPLHSYSPCFSWIRVTSPPAQKKSPPGNQWLFPSISSTPHFKRSSPAYTTHSTSSKLSPLDQQVKCQELQSISSVFDTSLVHSAPLQWGVDGMLTDLCLGCHRNTENGEVLFLDR